jgi:hypothetical protein
MIELRKDVLRFSFPEVHKDAVLAALKSVAELGMEKRDVPLPENESLEVDRVRSVGPKKRPNRVREGAF